MEEQIVKTILNSFKIMWAQNPLLLTLIGLLVMVTYFIRLPGVKGWIGETLMRLGFAFFLPKETYRIINNVTIPDGQGGTTQIDHIIVSAYGLFVIETKHYRGWIFGGENDRQWTQKIHGRHSQTFGNPLRQNYKHTECLRALLDLTRNQVKSVVVFTGECALKTRDKLPKHVTDPGGCVVYIKSHRDILFDDEMVAVVESAIRENRLTPGWKTAYQHVAYVKNLHPGQEEARKEAGSVTEHVEAQEAPIPDAPETAKVCPKCGAVMVLRTAKRGPNAGNQFWGCSNFPNCRVIKNTKNITQGV